MCVCVFVCVHVSVCGFECACIVYMWQSEVGFESHAPGTSSLSWETGSPIGLLF